MKAILVQRSISSEEFTITNLQNLYSCVKEIFLQNLTRKKILGRGQIVFRCNNPSFHPNFKIHRTIGNSKFVVCAISPTNLISFNPGKFKIKSTLTNGYTLIFIRYLSDNFYEQKQKMVDMNCCGRWTGQRVMYKYDGRSSQRTSRWQHRIVRLSLF